MTTTETLSARLKRLRVQRKLTAKAVARAIGVPESTYREWEYGRGLKLPPFQQICQVLAISVTELLTGEEPDLKSCLIELESIERKIAEIRSNMSSLI